MSGNCLFENWVSRVIYLVTSVLCVIRTDKRCSLSPADASSERPVFAPEKVVDLINDKQTVWEERKLISARLVVTACLSLDDTSFIISLKLGKAHAGIICII